MNNLGCETIIVSPRLVHTEKGKLPLETIAKVTFLRILEEGSCIGLGWWVVGGNKLDLSRKKRISEQERNCTKCKAKCKFKQ